MGQRNDRIDCQLGQSIGMSLFWGVDLGGTKIEAVVLEDPHRPSPLVRRRTATEREKGYRHILSRIRMLIDEIVTEEGLPRPDRIGFGTPGSCDPTTGRMRNCNTTCLNEQTLPADLCELLQAEVEVQNDANCFALAEALMGSAQGCSVVFGTIFGTGVGGGLVVEGRALPGRHGIAGEWGHTVIEPNGEDCYCGKKGCLETLVSGPSLERFHLGRTGKQESLKEVMTRGGEDAEAVEERLLRYVGESLGAVINLVDPDAVVLGGGVGQIPCLVQRLPMELPRWVVHPSPQTPILLPTLGDSAGVFGAALLVA